MARVRIVKVPAAKTGLEVRMKPMKPGLYGTNGNRQFSLPTSVNSDEYSQKDIEARNTLQPVDREDANLEAEKGETAVINIDGFPAHFKIGGKRHSEGGTPLNLPDNSFIFSDTAKMRIKDPAILKQFGMSEKGAGYTPAEIAKKYQLNEYRKVLSDPNSDDMERKTAELMIANFNEKLAKLAIAQESKKGFPQGMPQIAMPYMEARGVNPGQFIPTEGIPENPDADMGVTRYGGNIIAGWQKAYGGGLPTAQDGYSQVTKKTGEDFSDLVKYLREREAKQAKDQAAKDTYNKAYQTALKNWEVNKDKQKQAERKAASDKRAQYVAENELKRKAQIIRNYENEMKSGHPYASTEENLNNALSDYAAYKNKYFPTTITINSPGYKSKQEQAKPYVMDEGEQEWLNKKYGNKTPAPVKQASKDVVVDEEFAYGGSVLKKSQKGDAGKPIDHWEVSKKTGNRRPVYKDGTKGEVVKAEAKPSEDINIVKKGPKGAAPEKAKVLPYGQDPEVQDFLKKHLTAGAADLYQKEIGYQKKDPKTGHYGVEDITDEEWKKSNKQFLDEHPNFDPKNKAHIKDYENWYNKNTKDKAYRKALYDAQKKNMSPDEAEKYAQDFSDRVVNQIGFIDKPGDVRHKDMMWGKYHRSRKELEFQPDAEPEKAAPKIDIQPQEKQPEAAREPFKRNPPVPTKQGQYAPWWLQDIVGTAGAALDKSLIKRHQPWQATPQTFLPEATFYDPTRALAANAEQANIASQAMAAFSGPRNLSGIQGQAARQAADILSDYNNRNVGIANQLEQERAAAMNAGSQQRAQLATGLWDKYTMGNQDFENSMAKGREQVRRHVINAITNRAKTQTLNTLYPNYYTDPSTGGMLGFAPDFSKIHPTQPDNTDAFLKARELTGSNADAIELLKLNAKGAGNNPYSERMGYMGAQSGVYGEE